ncbi:hypothetical protein MBLNU459_g1218t1 [Dothideomycetes sp. NU459]
MDNHRSPTTIIVCSSRQAFIHEFLVELHPLPAAQTTAAAAAAATTQQTTEPEPALPPLLLPTLSQLAASRSITVAFCPELTHLLAYLSKLSHSDPAASPNCLGGADAQGHADQARPMLALLNPIRLHRPTSLFSCQGFNRTFAAAVDTAHRLRRQLVVAESVPCADPGHAGGRDESAAAGDEVHGPASGAEEQGVGADVGADSHSPWDEELSMLNVTTKTFGAGERGWVGRTVRIGQVAERWCEVVRLSDICARNDW